MRQVFNAWRDGIELLEEDETEEEEDEEVSIKFPDDPKGESIPILENIISAKQKFLTHKKSNF